MPPRTSRPPKKGGKKDLENKSKLAAAELEEQEGLETVFTGLSVNGSEKEEPDDGGRVATGVLISEPRARDIKVRSYTYNTQKCCI